MALYNNHVIYAGGIPRGGLLHTPTYRNPVIVPQWGGGFLDSLKSMASVAGKKLASHVAKEAKKGTLAVAQGLLEGKDLKSAVQDGSLQTVKNLKKQAAQEVMSRLNASAGKPNYHTKGRGQKRQRVQQKMQPGPAVPTPQKQKRGKPGGKKKKRRNQRGGNAVGNIFDTPGPRMGEVQLAL